MRRHEAPWDTALPTLHHEALSRKPCDLQYLMAPHGQVHCTTAQAFVM